MTAVGIDVSKAMLDLAFSDATKVHRFHNAPAGIRRLVELLRARPGLRMEPAGRRAMLHGLVLLPTNKEWACEI